MGDAAKMEGRALKELHDALLDAFPTPAALARMVHFELGENLHAVSDGDLSERVYDLLVWAKSQGRLEELIVAARRGNPGNQRLRALRFEGRAVAVGEDHHEARTLLAGPPADMTLPGHASTPTGVCPAGAHLSVWRGGWPKLHCFQFELHDQRQATLELTQPRTYYIGRSARRADGNTANDLVLPAGTVSRDAAAIERSGERVTIRNTSAKRSLIVTYDEKAHEEVPPGAKWTLAHGDGLAIGDVGGTFFDGRYHGTAPRTAVDHRSGLLSREGLVCEVALALAAERRTALVVVQLQRDDERSACTAAEVLHAREPAAPVARIGVVAAALVETGSDMADRVAAIRRAGLVPAATGWLDFDPGLGAEAGARIDAALAAVARIAAAGGNDAPADLAR